MKARIKGTTEWKDYKEVFGQYGEFMGLETKGYMQTDEEWCKERGFEYYPDSPLNSDHYISAILPLEAFDLPNEVDWQSFRAELAKDILCTIISNEGVADERNVDDFTKDNQVKDVVLYTDKLITKLKEKE